MSSDTKPAATPGPAWLATVAVGLPLLVWLATVVVMSWHPAEGDISIAAGGAKFRDYCGACHIVEKGITTHHGPNLYEIGKVAASRKPGMSAAAYILESILDPAAFVAPMNRTGMPQNIARDLSPEEIRNLVAFLASRQATPQYDDILALNIPDLRQPRAAPTLVRREQMELAEQVLRDKGGCLQCHALFRNAEHLIFAPALFAVGLKDRQLVRESIVDPSKVVSPAYCTVNVALQSGKIVSGRLLTRNDQGLLLAVRDEEGHLVQQTVPMAEVEVEDGQPLIVQSSVSLMPSGFQELLTNEELDALVNMIDQLN